MQLLDELTVIFIATITGVTISHPIFHNYGKYSGQG
jgi:hypothetical protein